MTNFLLEKISKGQTVIGTWNIIPSPIISEIFSMSKLDFQILDMEHGSFGFETLGSCIKEIDRHEATPLVRVPGIGLHDVQRALDLGAQGIIFPQISSLEDASTAIKTTMYYPEGNRGFNPFTRSGKYGFDQSSNLQNNDKILKSIIVENVAAYSQMDEILRIPHLNMVYLGAYDMSVALGVPGKIDSPEVSDFIQKGVKKIRDANKIVGLMCKDNEQAKKFMKMGVQFVVIGVDSHLIGSGLTRIVKELK